MATMTARDTNLTGALVQTMHVLEDLYAETSRPLGLTPQLPATTRRQLGDALRAFLNLA
jgi:hypothetical protein